MSNGRLKPKFPLPPKQAAGKKPLHRRVLRAAASAPGKLLQRVNEELYKRNAELRARNRTLALLRKLDEISLASVAVNEMAQRISEAIATELGYDLATIAVVEESNQLKWLSLASSVPWLKNVVQQCRDECLSRALPAKSATAKVLQEQTMQFTDQSETVYPPALVQALSRADATPNVEEVKHTAIFPLRYGDHVLGLLTLSSSRPFQSASKYEQESVTGIVGLVSLAMYKAKIYQDLQTTTGKLEAANQKLTDLDKANKEFLSLASHQLYTPVTALKGYLSMIQEGDFGITPEKFVPIIEILRQSTENLVTLIKQYLDISRIEAGRLELKLESLELAAMGKQLVQDLLPNAMAKHLQLNFHPPTQNIPQVVADQDRIWQVMLNFVDNAIKYTPQGSIDVRVTSTSDQVVFSVTDTGRGMTREEIKRLFVKFARVGGESRFRTEGTGLGLYLAGKIVKEHHGEVSVQSPGPGQGSTFSMILPVEGSDHSLKVGEHMSVEMKAAEAVDKKSKL